jgi:phage shock protein C
MTASTGNLFTRDDTLLGVCEAIGEDLGFHPNYLRVTLAVLLLWNPTVIICGYAAAATVVLASRLLWPNRPRRAAKKEGEVVTLRRPDVIELPLAA